MINKDISNTHTKIVYGTEQRDQRKKYIQWIRFRTTESMRIGLRKMHRSSVNRLCEEKGSRNNKTATVSSVTQNNAYYMPKIKNKNIYGPTERDGKEITNIWQYVKQVRARETEILNPNKREEMEKQ